MKQFFICAVFAAGLTNSPLWAQTSVERTQLSATLGQIKYDAKEFSVSGAVINHESGTLPFVQVGLRHALTPAYFIDTSWRYADSKIQYDGFTQIGIPLTTRTQLAWHQVSASIGYRQAISDAHSVEWTLGLGERRLDRDIQASLGSLPLREVLNTTQLQLGAKWQHKLSAHTQWHAGIQLHPTLRQSLLVDSYGLYDPITLRPAKQLDKRIFAGLSHALSPIWQIQANVGLDIMKPGASASDIWRKNSVAVASVRYPGSTQRGFDISARLAAVF